MGSAPKQWVNRVEKGIGTGFGLGFAPVASGTVGTLGAIPLAFILWKVSIPIRLLLLLSIVAVAVWASDGYQKGCDRPDPSEVVIDEVAGYLVTVLFLPSTWLSVAVGFFWFRTFDIVKPFPVDRMERFSGGFGIVMDDVVAGLYAWALSGFTLRLWEWWLKA